MNQPLSKTGKNNNFWPGRKMDPIRHQNSKDSKRETLSLRANVICISVDLEGFTVIKPQDNHHCFKRTLNYDQCPPSKMHGRTIFMLTQSGGDTAAPQCAALS